MSFDLDGWRVEAARKLSERAGGTRPKAWLCCKAGAGVCGMIHRRYETAKRHAEELNAKDTEKVP